MKLFLYYKSTYCAVLTFIGVLHPLYASFNAPYRPEWGKTDNLETLRQIFLSLPEHLDYVNPFKDYAAWHITTANVDNPNAFKIFFPTEEKKKSALWHWRQNLTQALNETAKKIENHDEFYSEMMQKEISDAEASFKRIESQYGQKDPKTVEFHSKRLVKLKSDLKNPENKKLDKEKLEKKLEKLNSLKDQLMDPNLIRVIDPIKPEAVVNYPSKKSNGREYQLSLPKLVPVIVFDDFNKRDPGQKSILDNPYLKNRILPQAKGEGFSCSEHACHVAGIVARLAPFAQLVPKTMLPSTGDILSPSGVFARTADDIIKNDYGARVINISVHLPDDVALAIMSLCQNHIVVVAAGNYGKRVPQIFNELLKDENTRKHLLIAVNTMPDGKTISPMSNIPSGEKTAEATVAAPGTWMISTLPLDIQSVSSAEGKFYKHYGLMTGTSQAAPVVTALVARLLAQFPDLSLGQIVKIIKDSANKEGDTANKPLFGNGLIDVQAAEEMARLLKR